MLMNYLKREDVAGLDYEDLPEVAEDEFDVAGYAAKPMRFR